MLHLTNHTATVTSYNARAENHGGEPTPAGDLSLQFDLPSAELEHFDSGLREAMFRTPHTGEQQALIGDAFTAVRFPRIGTWPWSEEYPGYQLEIGGSLGLDEPLQLIDVNLKGFSFEPLEGGSVRVKCKAQVHPSDAEEAGALCFAVKNEVQLTLVPPVKAEEPQQLDLSDAANSDDDQLQQAADGLENAA